MKNRNRESRGEGIVRIVEVAKAIVFPKQKRLTRLAFCWTPYKQHTIIYDYKMVI